MGYIIYPHYCLSRKRVVGNIKAKLRRFNGLLASARPEDRAIIVKQAQATVNSYWGHFKYANCGSLKRKLYAEHFGELKKYLEKSPAGEHFVIKNGVFPKRK